MNVKQCENCFHYVKHFVRHGSTMVAVPCGHCVNLQLSAAQKSKRAHVCELWETDAPKKAERRENVQTLLRQIAEQLSVIAAYLENDQLP